MHARAARAAAPPGPPSQRAGPATGADGAREEDAGHRTHRPGRHDPADGAADRETVKAGAGGQGFVIRFTRTDEEVATILDEITSEAPPSQQAEEAVAAKAETESAGGESSAHRISRKAWWILAAVAGLLAILAVLLLTLPDSPGRDSSTLPPPAAATPAGTEASLRSAMPDSFQSAAPGPNCPVGWTDVPDKTTREDATTTPAGTAEDGSADDEAGLAVPPTFRVDRQAQAILWIPRRGDSLWKLHAYLQTAERVPYPPLAVLGQSYWQLFLSRVEDLNPGLTEPDLILPSQPIRLAPAPGAGG